KRRFVPRVEFVTSPAWLRGDGSRRAAGLLFGGVSRVVATLGLLGFDPETKRMLIEAVHAGETVETIRANTGFELGLAPALGTTDVVSKGRLILGVAAGWYAREFDAVGVPFKQRGRLFERNLEILTRLWTEDRVTFQADEFDLREAVMRPRTVQRPRPPILIGGYVDAVLKRVATRGDGWLTYFYTAESYRSGWAKLGGFAHEA